MNKKEEKYKKSKQCLIITKRYFKLSKREKEENFMRIKEQFKNN